MRLLATIDQKYAALRLIVKRLPDRVLDLREHTSIHGCSVTVTLTDGTTQEVRLNNQQVREWHRATSQEVRDARRR